MTDDRIRAAQKNIRELLVAKPEYVVTNFRVNDVKGRLLAMAQSRKVDDKMPTNRRFAEVPDRQRPVETDENGKTPKSDRTSGRL